MMFLVEGKLLGATKRQYIYKLKAYFQLLFNLIIFQAVGIVFSTVSTISENINFVTLITYSNTIVTVFSFIMLFSVGYILQTEKYKNLDVAVVGNSYTSSFSDIAYIITICIFGGITTSLGGVLLRILIYFIKSGQNIVGEGFFIPPKVLLIGIISTFLYAVLISSLGYLLGAIAQINKVLLLIIPALIIGSMFLILSNNAYSNTVAVIRDFYVSEVSMVMFIIKIFVTSAILFSVAVKIASNLEVRR